MHYFLESMRIKHHLLAEFSVCIDYAVLTCKRRLSALDTG